MLNHSIITTYRNRPQHLHLFLQSLQFCQKYINHPPEIIITELSSNTTTSSSIINQFNTLNINHIKIPYDGLFHKTKALNHAILKSKNQFITILDVDCIFPLQFLKNINDYMKNNENHKLAHRVRQLDNHTSSIIKQSHLTEKVITTLTTNSQNYRIYPEHYDNDAKLLNYLPIKKQKQQIIDHAQGCSLFTIKKDIILSVGAYDERFIGRGNEDRDINERLYKHLGNGYIQTDNNCNAFHVYHEQDWNTQETQKRNSQLFEESKNNGVVRITKNDDFGQF